MVQSIVELGEFNSKEEIVEYALRKYVEGFRTKYLQESKDYQEVLDKEKKRKHELEVMV
jgi:Arc/MetJ-type ribon-helix-helix transcriptional regulator